MTLILSQGWAAPAATPKPKDPLPPDKAAEQAFKKGVEAFKNKQFDVAVTALTGVPELGGGFYSLYKHWFLAESDLELGKYKEAEPEFAKVMQGQASKELKYQAQFGLAEVALRQKKYNEATQRLKPLERKWRHSYRYPEVLYRLMVADLRLGHIKSACQRARKLYAHYPAHGLVIGWGRELQEVTVDGRKLPCSAEKDDFAQRVRSLQWAGESEKAHQELMDLLAKTGDKDRFELDMTMASFLINEGSVDDALNLLTRYYPEQKSDTKYLTLLGRAAARSGEYQTAVGAFERIATLTPRSKQGREALFQAAYLSYQFQDYDGAIRKFQEFVKRNPRSGLARDAQWHLAWLQYLRGDYKGALEKFKKVARTRRRRKADSLEDRLLYWTAMAHIHLNEWQEAGRALDTILSHSHYSYYGLAASVRLEQIKPKLDEDKPRILGSHQPVPYDVEPDPAPAATSTPAPASATAATVSFTATPATATAAASDDSDEEQESEEDLTADEDVESGTTAAAAENGDDSDEGIHPSNFKDPALRARIDVAQKLIQYGLPELARWELIEVERRTRNPQYLRRLINAYEGIGSYYRSAGIAELNFSGDRDRYGLDGARFLWNSMYPQAYKDVVEAAAKKYSVPPEWVWAIMRTESLYKPDVISPVGARGLMQLMPFTARNLSKLDNVPAPDGADMLLPNVSIPLGAQYLGRLMQKFSGQLALVAAAYNAGPHRVDGWLVSFGHLDTDEFVEHIPFLETRNYAKKVIRSFALYRQLYAADPQAAAFLGKPLGVPIPTRAATREDWESM